MTEREWLECAEPLPMLAYLDGQVSRRKLQLFAVACCRSLWDLLGDERSRQLVQAVEAFADGQLHPNDLAYAKKEAWAAHKEQRLQGWPSPSGR